MARTNNPVDSLKRLSVLASFLFCLEILGEVPDDDACSDGNVEGVLGAELGNFQAAVRSINDFLMDALDFVAENDSVFLIRSGRERLEHRGTMSLFDGEDFIALRLQGLKSLKSRRVIVPGDAVLSTQGGLVDLSAGRRRGDAAEIDSLNAEGIARAEDTAHVVHRPHIVEHHHQRQFLGLAELLHREALHLYRAKLLQNYKIKRL